MKNTFSRFEMWSQWRETNKHQRHVSVHACWDLKVGATFGPYGKEKDDDEFKWMPQVKRATRIEEANLLGEKRNEKFYFTVIKNIQRKEDLCVWFELEPEITFRYVTSNDYDELVNKLRRLKIRTVYDDAGFDIKHNRKLAAFSDFGQLADTLTKNKRRRPRKNDKKNIENKSHFRMVLRRNFSNLWTLCTEENTDQSVGTADNNEEHLEEPCNNDILETEEVELVLRSLIDAVCREEIKSKIALETKTIGKSDTIEQTGEINVTPSVSECNFHSEQDDKETTKINKENPNINDNQVLVKDDNSKIKRKRCLNGGKCVLKTDDRKNLQKEKRHTKIRNVKSHASRTVKPVQKKKKLLIETNNNGNLSYKCEICEERFPLKAYLLCHIAVIHDNPTKKKTGKRRKTEEDTVLSAQYECTSCGRKYKFEESLKFHRCEK